MIKNNDTDHVLEIFLKIIRDNPGLKMGEYWKKLDDTLAEEEKDEMV